MISARRLVSRQEAASYLSVSVRTIRRYIAKGDLNGYRIGPRIIRVDVAELDKLARPIPSASVA